MVHVEQDPRHDLEASPLSTVLGYDLDLDPPNPNPDTDTDPNPNPNRNLNQVLGYDLERSLLRRRLADLGAKREEAAQAAEVAAPGEKGAADRHAARVQKRCEEALQP